MGGRRRLCCGALLLLGLVGQLLLMVRLGHHRLLLNRTTDTGDAPDSVRHLAGAPDTVPEDSAAPDAVPNDSAAPNAVPNDSAAPDVVLDDSPPHLVIILSSSPRSGSSLLGEILSTSPNTAYFFEPFYYHVKNNMSVALLPGEAVRQTLRQLLTCQLNQTAVLRQAMYRRFIWRPAQRPRIIPGTAVLAKHCAASTTRVVKLVRPRLSQLLPLLEDAELGPRLRLVHLVRDPRGTLNSQLHATTVWSKLVNNLSGYCTGLRADLAAARPLRDPRYLRVHYEQLALQPRRVAAELHRSLRLPQPASLHAYFDRHMNSSQLVAQRPQQGKRTEALAWRGPAPPADRHLELEQRRSEVRLKRSATQGRRPAAKQQPAVARRPAQQQLQLWKQQNLARKKAKLMYFSTYRGPGFDPHHWRKELRPEVLHQIERYCADVITQLQAEVSAEVAGAGPSTAAAPPR